METGILVIAEQATRLADELPADTLRLVAGVVAQSDSPGDAVTKLAQAVAHPHYRKLATRFLQVWGREASGISPREVSAALLVAAQSGQVHHEEQHVELVWTGPEVGGVPFRLTKQAILEVLNSAERRITLISYAVYKIPDIRKALVDAARRGVRITVVVETPDEREGRDEYDTLGALGDDVARCSTVYYWPRASRAAPGEKVGILHVKCVVADSKQLFVSSANLTEHAFTRNMELGVLIRGGHMPEQVERHFDALIAGGVFARA